MTSRQGISQRTCHAQEETSCKQSAVIVDNSHQCLLPMSCYFVLTQVALAKQAIAHHDNSPGNHDQRQPSRRSKLLQKQVAREFENAVGEKEDGY